MEWAAEIPRTNFQFAIVLAANEQVIGCAGLRQSGYPRGEGEIGIEINPEYWRQGFARETVSALIEFGTSRLLLETFWGCTTPANHRAQALIEEFGFARWDLTDDTVRLRWQVPA